ncbi:MAG: 2-hydroxyacyl-CoA dehydratase family protein, partial [Chloroflexota bacterium]
HAVKYVAEELRQMIAFLERHGFRFDEERLAQAVKRSRRTMELRQEVEEYRKAVPVPMTTVDALSCIGNTLITLLGSDAGVEIMRRLRDEVSLRVRDKQGVIGDEKLRLYLVGVPPVYNLGLLDYPEKYGAVVVKSDLDYIGGCVMAPELLVPERPLESLALKQLADIVNPCYETRIDMAVETVKEYHIDGVIGLNKRGCRNLPAALRLVKDAIYRETGVPMTIFDLDGIDAREYNDAQVKANIDSFMETLIQHRVGG